MAAFIGTQPFITLKGQLKLRTTAVETFHRPGVNGTGFQNLGGRAEQTTLISTVDVPSLAAVGNVFRAYELFQGTLKNITDDFGNTYTNFFIHNVQRLSAKAVGITAGGINPNPAAILVCQWTVQAQ